MTVPNLDHIAEALRPLAVPVGELVPDPANANTHPDKNLDAIEASFREFGQVLPFLVDADGRTVRGGNGGLAVAKRLGWSHVAVVNSGKAGRKAVALGIALNRTAKLSVWNDDGLARLLEDLNAHEPDLLAAAGFSEEDFDEVLRAAGATDDEEELDLSPVNVKPPPRMAWALIGIPLVRFGEIAQRVEQLAAVPGVVCRTTGNDG